MFRKQQYMMNHQQQCPLLKTNSQQQCSSPKNKEPAANTMLFTQKKESSKNSKSMSIAKTKKTRNIKNNVNRQRLRTRRKKRKVNVKKKKKKVYVKKKEKSLWPIQSHPLLEHPDHDLDRHVHASPHAGCRVAVEVRSAHDSPHRMLDTSA